MVTLNNIREFGANRNVLDIVGLSTDTKPISTIESLTITNGSIFTEIDTANIFMFDEENRTWPNGPYRISKCFSARKYGYNLFSVRRCTPGPNF